MNFAMKAVVAGAAAIMLSACTTMNSINDVANMPATGNAFTDGLRDGYVAQAKKEASEYDWINAGMFRDKAAAAARGQAVTPEDPNSWSIYGKDLKAELVKEHSRLLDALNKGGRTKYGALGAKAQVGFDCWVEEASEGPPAPGPVASFQPTEMAKCRTAYMTAMDDLAKAMKPKSEPVVMEQQTKATEFIVYFGWDVAKLSPLAQSFLNDVATEAKKQEPSSIAIKGYTDTSGPAAYNMKLSKWRADNVATYLAGKGVSRSIMDVRWFGENDLMVKTGPNVREPNNRRVEIDFK